MSSWTVPLVYSAGPPVNATSRWATAVSIMALRWSRVTEWLSPLRAAAPMS
ncbi:hypothetical protein ACFVJ5_33470 [Nocardia sp. NPDC127606]|uniref:hypothetical protein n=1 Tax=Nocardia sp. NPDC127606 TaxID=3345406 RepID=UPI00363F28D2